ncbi:MAG TPA: arsenosugar biosynthesis-associated peroxidase-like protein [Kofleriaceae bacterium]
MKLDPHACKQVLGKFLDLGVIQAAEIDEVMALFSPSFPWAASMGAADSVHVHLRVDDVARLPHDRIVAMGTHAENAKDGYIKYPFAGGINVILSSIDVAEDDWIPGPGRARPYLDHIGVDLRDESPATKAIFDETPVIAKQAGWRTKPQGGNGTPVYCCHVEVGAKHWVYAPTPGAACIELAFGALIINGDSMGCDLRPIDPAHPKAAQAVCGDHASSEAGAAPATGSHYNVADLGRFGEMGQNAGPLWEKFLAYYSAATGEDSALTRREKALIGLAVAHAKQCPYCIDAYVGNCVSTGASVEQMHEAVHVAAALAAGIDLVHGVQMRNALAARGKL